jgi:glycosyltransferase involved in cell wall biosynthesis
VIYQPHCYAFEDPTQRPTIRLFYRCAEHILAKRTFRVAAVSRRELTLAASMVGSDRTLIIPNVSSLESLFTNPKRDYEHSLVTVGMIGRVCAQKDPAFFARVAAQISSLRPNIRFRWIGDGPDPDNHHILANSGVMVTGWKQGEALARELQSLDIYLHSAKYEGFPISVIEAAASSLPIIARSTPAYQGTSLLQVSTAEECVQTILKLVSDPGFRDATIKRSEELAALHSTKRLQEALSVLYRNLEN